MTPMIAPCGFRCDRCVAFRPNARKHADRVRGSALWARYWRLQVPPQRMACNGCRAERVEGGQFPEKRCRIRPCVLGRGFETCAECGEYPCKLLQRRLADCDQVVEEFRGQIDGQEYERAIAPYDRRATLEARRREK